MKIKFPSFRNLRLILLSLILAGFFQSYSQIRVSKVASPESLTGKKGVVYNLPRTLMLIELQVSKTQIIPGPLAEFTKEFLGINDAVTKTSIAYDVVNATISTLTEPDPEQNYLIEKEEKSSGEIWISFGKDGLVMTMEKFLKESKPAGFSHWDMDLQISPQPNPLFRKYSDASTREVIDTIIRRVSIDTLVIEEKVFKRSMVGFTDREKAKEASERIRQIEQDKYNLLIGYQETAYSGEALEFMYGKLEEERLEYRKLFTGVVIREMQNFRFEVVPDPGLKEQEYVITGFSKSQGIVPADDQNVIMLSLIDDNLLQGLPDVSGQALTGLVYRNPSSLAAIITFQGKEISDRRIEVLQLGPIYTLPGEFKRIEFDAETGSVRSVVME